MMQQSEICWLVMSANPLSVRRRNTQKLQCPLDRLDGALCRRTEEIEMEMSIRRTKRKCCVQILHAFRGFNTLHWSRSARMPMQTWSLAMMPLGMAQS